MKPNRKLISMVVVFAGLLAFWLMANPPGRFGWCCYGYSTYGAWPRPLSDFQVRADRSVRAIAKTHSLAFEQIQWLLDPKPDVLIIALGWDGVTTPDGWILDYKGCEVHRLRNKEAIELFNRLQRSGKRVAIHYHSTC